MSHEMDVREADGTDERSRVLHDRVHRVVVVPGVAGVALPELVGGHDTVVFRQPVEIAVPGERAVGAVRGTEIPAIEKDDGFPLPGLEIARVDAIDLDPFGVVHRHGSTPFPAGGGTICLKVYAVPPGPNTWQATSLPSWASSSGGSVSAQIFSANGHLG